MGGDCKGPRSGKNCAAGFKRRALFATSPIRRSFATAVYADVIAEASNGKPSCCQPSSVAAAIGKKIPLLITPPPPTHAACRTVMDDGAMEFCSPDIL